MRRRLFLSNRRLRLLLFLIGLTAATLASAASRWPKIERALADWSGPKRAVLRTDLPDPFASPVAQDLIAVLVERGFTVVPTPVGGPAGEGVVLDLRTGGGTAAVALARGSDGAILAFERMPGTGTVPPASEAVDTAAAGRTAPPPPVPTEATGMRFPQGPVELAGHPRSLVVLGAGRDGPIDVALLYDDRLECVSLSPAGVAVRGHFAPPVSSSRALHLGAGDLDRDGSPELAALWAEDLRGVYEGVDSALHSWVLRIRGDAPRPTSEDLSAYARIVGSRGYAERRGRYAAYQGPVVRLTTGADGYLLGDEPQAWAGRHLFDATPLDDRTALVWRAGHRLALADRVTGAEVPGSLLLADLGEFRGPEVAVRLEHPEYRSGWQKEDQVKETYHVLPARVLVVSDDTAYTLERGRSEGVPLIGSPSGHDAVVRVVREGPSLRLERPFEAVDAFVLDFALIGIPGTKPTAVLLLNDEPDGSGTAYLLLQTGRPEGTP